MNTIQLIDCSELALAGYGQFDVSGRPPLSTDLTILNGDTHGFSTLQGDQFRKRFELSLPTFNDATSLGGSGQTSLDLTVFQGTAKLNQGKIYITFRGTGQKNPLNTPNDLESIAENVNAGAAVSQIVAMYNWWQRVSTIGRANLPQYGIVSVSYDAAAPAGGLSLIGVGRGGALTKDYLFRLPDASSTGEVATLLLATPGAKVTVTGSSLGGHLAMAFAALFPPSTEAAVAFNSPGFANTGYLQTLFAALGGTVPAVGNPLITNLVAREVNIAVDPWDLLAGFPGGSFPGIQLTVPIENQYLTDVPDAKVPSWNHDQRQITDALTVFDMLRRLDPSLDLFQFDNLMRASAEGENRSLENLVDTVESLLGINRLELLAGNDNRDKLHGAVQAMVGGAPQAPDPNAAFLLLSGKVSIVQTDASLRVHARENFGALVALQELMPFYLRGKDAAVQTALDVIVQSTRTSDYDAWSRDKAADIALTFTDKWIADRLALVRALAIQYTANNTTGQVFDQRVPANETFQFSYVGGAIPPDQTQPERHTLFAQSRPGQPSQVIFFGTGGADVATGNGNMLGDHLYGGAGNDWLDGLAGNDYLEGGSGDDCYLFSANFGQDIVYDADGVGSLKIDGHLLHGGEAFGKAGEWLGQDGAGWFEHYILQNNRLSSTGHQLVVSRLGAGGNTITIDHFDLAAAQSGAGYLGIHFDDTQQLLVAQAGAAPADGNSPFAAWNFDPNAFTGQREELTTLAAPVSGVVHQLATHLAGGAETEAQVSMVMAIPSTLTLNGSHIDVDGKMVRLSPGMNLTAEVKTGRRRVIEYLLSPIQRAGSESLRER